MCTNSPTITVTIPTNRILPKISRLVIKHLACFQGSLVTRLWFPKDNALCHHERPVRFSKPNRSTSYAHLSSACARALFSWEIDRHVWEIDQRVREIGQHVWEIHRHVWPTHQHNWVNHKRIWPRDRPYQEAKQRFWATEPHGRESHQQERETNQHVILSTNEEGLGPL